MNNTPTTQPKTIKSLFEQNNVKQKFNEILGARASQFMTSVLQISNSNSMLSNAEPLSIYNSALLSATLNLPLNNALGFAYIVPYNQKQQDGSFKVVAQFQLGYKGFIQLAQRSGQFKTIGASAIYEGQLIDENQLTGCVFDFKAKKSDIVIGYASHFSLLNGFEKTMYMSIDELKKHGLKYSKTYSNSKTKSSSLWENNFESMATKTMIKLLLSKYAPLSIEMQTAIITDQSLINNENATDVTYIDTEHVEIDKEKERLTLMLNDCKSIDDVEFMQQMNPNIDVEIFNKRKTELKGGSNA
jgi:recombination protein RecT